MRLRGQRDGGFTLVELLIVMIVIAILVGTAIPLFVRHRERAHRATAVNDLRVAALEIESFAVQTNGVYSDADGWTTGDLEAARGIQVSQWVDLVVTATPSSYCILGVHELIPDLELLYRGEGGTVVMGPPADVAC